MSDLLKKFKSVFIVEDETPSSGNTASETAPAQNTPQPPIAPNVPQVTAQGSVSNKFVEILGAALEKNNQEGFDYFEFRQSLINLAKMPMDEATRFQSAYAMAQAMGATPAKLIESAKFYVGVLSNEQARFNEAHAQQRSKLIGGREEEAKNLEATIKQKAEQIKLLTQEIEQHQKQAEQIRKEVSDSTIKIENTKSDFEATFASVVGQLQADIAKIQQYLK